MKFISKSKQALFLDLNFLVSEIFKRSSLNAFNCTNKISASCRVIF